jgi:hypothetical protein
MTHVASRVVAEDVSVPFLDPDALREDRAAARSLRIARALVDIEPFCVCEPLTDGQLGELAGAAARLGDACTAELRARLHRTRDWRRA